MAFNWFKKLKTGLSKSALKVEKALSSVVGKKSLDEETLSQIEEQLIASDLGVNSSLMIVDKLRKHKFELTTKNKEITKTMIHQVVMGVMGEILDGSEKNLFDITNEKPHVILLSGVNGSGKTTTAGKIASKLREKNKKVIIAACDTFRAAAVAQLEQWALKTNSDFVKGMENSDAASVAYQALNQAIEKNADYLIIDTAGRLQNKSDLMEELSKICRVLSKLNPDAPQDKVVVLDVTVGQNAHSQLQHFHDLIKLTGIIITKLDGSAKGGVIISLFEKFNLPIFAVGVGEKVDDLDIFKKEEYAKAILNLDWVLIILNLD